MHLELDFRLARTRAGCFQIPPYSERCLLAESWTLKYSVGRYNHQTHTPLNLTRAFKYALGRVPVSNRYDHHLVEWNRLNNAAAWNFLIRAILIDH